jgi:cytochrome c-type biogenesis protein CcmH
MIAAALLWIALPLVRSKAADAGETRGERRISALVVAVALPLLAVAMYADLSDWNWEKVAIESANQADRERLLQRLQARLQSNPQDLEGWLLLGKSYTDSGRFPLAVDAFQHAYDLSKGENVEAIVGLGEALVLTDEASLAGRAGELFDAALAKRPNDARALFFGGMAALQAGKLQLGRDRLQMLKALLPEHLRPTLERQIQDINQQLAEAGQGGATAPATEGSAQRTIKVAVSVAPEIQQQLREPRILFVLARDPSTGGPPLAAQRVSNATLPLTIELSDKDALMGRGLAGVARVQVVARLSKAGTANRQSGDFEGAADYEFAADQGAVSVVINSAVP